MLTTDLIQAIDARIRRGEQNIVAFGVVTTMTTVTDAMVTFDGSAAPVPCKVLGDAQVLEGDRVTLVKVKPWWVVIGTLTRRWPGGVVKSGLFISSTGSTTSATLVDLPTILEVSFTKMWDDTRVQLQMHGSCYVDSAPTMATFGVSMTGSAGVATSYNIAYQTFNVANSHMAVTNVASRINIPADTYLVRAQYARQAGTGTIFVDGNDQVGFAVTEISP